MIRSPLSDHENVSPFLLYTTIPAALYMDMMEMDTLGCRDGWILRRLRMERTLTKQTLPSPSDKRPSTGLTVEVVAHHVSSSGKSSSMLNINHPRLHHLLVLYPRLTAYTSHCPPAAPFMPTGTTLIFRITRAFLIEEATIVKRVLKAKTTGKK